MPTDGSGVQISNATLKLSAKEVLFKYLIYLPLFILVLSISISVTYIYLRYKVPMFSSSISVLIKDDKKNANQDVLEALVGGPKKANLANEIEILKSVTLM